MLLFFDLVGLEGDVDGAALFHSRVVFEQTKVLGLVNLAVGVLNVQRLAVGFFGKAQGVLGHVAARRTAVGVGHVDFDLVGVLVVLVAGADDANEVVDAGNLDAVARQQHVVEG